MKSVIIPVILAASTPLTAGTSTKDLCFPKNNLHLQDNLFSLNANIDEVEFNKIIDSVINAYTPIVASHGATLSVERNWDDGTVNAYANQEGTNWTVAMFGGLARRPEVTPDGFALVVCHEVGHHLGGFPYYGDDWAASEGQSDYFATQACASKIWGADTATNATFRATVPAIVKEKCDAVHQSTERQDLCYRAGAAGKSLAELLAALNEQPVPMFETPDPRVVDETVTRHPDGQCRLDTYFSGALCAQDFPDMAIPGRGHTDGQQSIGAESVASQVSCTDAGFYELGKRPRCWFAPQLTLKIDAAAVTKSEIAGDGDTIWEPGETFGINVPLLNRLFAPVDGATLNITDVNTAVNGATYPTIPVGEMAYATSPIAIGSPRDQQCGDRFSALATVQVRNWRQDTQLNFMLGETIVAEHIEAAPGTAIPDDDQTGISDVLTASAQGEAVEVKLTVSITHTYSSDLQIKLVSPLGREYVVFDQTSGAGANIRRDFVVPVQREPIAGAWVLKVIDAAQADEGTLDSWALDFSAPHCSQGLNKLGIKFLGISN